MKSLIASLLALFLLTLSLSAQYESTLFLYDTISEGPLLTPEKGGYNFIFKTSNVGTMVSTRGQVVNHAIRYDMFNHYHIQGNGQTDSIFAVPIRSNVNHHYTMYKRGAPKLLQFRVGTSNDYSLEQIASKYPIINNIYSNDETFSQSKISVENNQFKSSHKSIKKGEVTESDSKANFENAAAVGYWEQKAVISYPNVGGTYTSVLYGKKVDNNIDLRYNDLHEFKLLALDQNGTIDFEEEINLEKAYLYNSSGVIHNSNAQLVGYYISLIEASGKANKEYVAANQKIIFLDQQGRYQSETLITLPFEPKSKEANLQKVIKVIQVKNEFNILVYTPGSKKSRIKEGIYTFVDFGGTGEEVDYKTIKEISVGQMLRNKPEEMVQNFGRNDYKYVEKLENGDLLIVATKNGKNIQFLQLDEKANIKYNGNAYLLCDVEDSESMLTFEHLENNKLLLVSKVADGKSVKTSYSIYQGRYGRLNTVQPREDISSIYSYRNGDEIIVFGNAKENNSLFLFKQIKLNKYENSLSSIGRK